MGPDRIPTGRVSTRALRRHHRDRMIAHARAVLQRTPLDPATIEREAVRHHDYFKVCSCSLCRNPRRTLGERTRQEQRVANLPLRGGRGRVEGCD